MTGAATGRRDLRLVPVAAGAWAAALSTTAYPGSAVPAAAASWLAAAVMIMLAARRRISSRRRQGWAVAAIVLAAAATSATHVAIAEQGRAAEAAAAGTGRALIMTVVVTGKVERDAAGLRFDAVVEQITVGERTHSHTLPVLVRAAAEDAGAAAWDVGARVRISGTATRADPGDRAVLVVRAREPPAVLSEPQSVLAATAALRDRLVDVAAQLPGPGAGLVPGLAVGVTSAVAPETDAAMKASSLSHLTAVSGANCAIVVAGAFWLAAVCGASRGIRVAAAVAVLAGFVVLVTPEPSVVRAAAMAGTGMIAVLLGRAGAGLAVLCLAVAVLLVVDPWLAGELGFALSVAATAALLLLARPLADGLGRWMPAPLALAVAVPLAAQLACGPLLALITPSVPVYGVVANVLAAPAAPVATIVGLVACLAAPVPVLQAGLVTLAWLPASWIAGVARLLADAPGAALPWPAGVAGLGVLAIVGAAVAVVVAPPRAGRAARRVRAGSALLLSVVTGIAVGSAALGGALARVTVPGDWVVGVCDVGQGDAVLLRSAEAVALVDAGEEPALLEACLARFGVDRIDLFVLTHFDVDHAGGASAVRGRVDVMLHGPVPDAGATTLLADMGEAGARVTQVAVGQRGALGHATWRVLWPRARSVGFAPGNDASVVIDVAGGGLPAVLLLGDLSAAPQRALAAAGELRDRYDIVKVAHHGSADQHPALYEDAHPAVALVTVGLGNDYGHPREEILALLGELGTVVARTDTQGAIAIGVERGALTIWRERSPPRAP